MMQNELFTIGHSTHELAHFIGLLTQHSIDAVCDVRSQPYSQYASQFNKDSVKRHLRENEIAYVFLGNELGARSDNPDCYDKGKVQFQKLANEPAFQHGINRLREGMKKHRIALMCAEQDPITCHRMILVGRALQQFAIQIKHILSDGTIETNTQAEQRLLDTLHIGQDLWRVDDSECIADAYRKQGQCIAYVKKDKPASVARHETY